MSIVAAHPALAIWGAIIIAVCLAAYAYLRLTGERGRHAEARQFEASLDAAWHKAPPAPEVHYDWYAAPTITLAAAAPAAGAPEPPAGDEAPGPDGLPEGDTQLLWPPQETAGPGDLLAEAIAAVKDAPLDGYLSEAAAASSYADDGSLWDCLSADTIARGMKAVS